MTVPLRSKAMRPLAAGWGCHSGGRAPVLSGVARSMPRHALTVATRSAAPIEAALIRVLRLLTTALGASRGERRLLSSAVGMPELYASRDQRTRVARTTASNKAYHRSVD